MIKQFKAQIKAALGGRMLKKGLDAMQSDARSSSSANSHLSVQVIDPVRFARAFAAADDGDITEQSMLFALVEQNDAHIFSELAKRRRAVTGLGWQIEPPLDATQSELDRCAELRDMLAGIGRFEDTQYDITDAIGKGFAAHEIEWRLGSEWVPKALHLVPQRDFRIDRATGSLMYLKAGMPEALREFGWVVHEHRSLSGYIEQAALFRVLAWTHAYKAYNQRDMQRFLETYGLPLRLGKYPAGIDKGQRDALLRAVRNLGTDQAGIVPSTMQIDFIEAATGRVGDFIDAIEYWERKQSMSILGGTLTSQADGKTSTNALGEIHNQVRREIMLHDVRQIEPTINAQLLQPIVALNGIFPADRMPRFAYLTEETVDQAKMVDVLTKATNIGMRIDLDWAHKALQIPRAADDATVLQHASKAPAKPGADAALMRLVALAAANPQSRDVDITTAYTAQLATLCAPFEEALIQQIGAIVAEAGDFDEALAGVEKLRADPKWAEAMALGMTAAHLAGRADVDAGK